KKSIGGGVEVRGRPGERPSREPPPAGATVAIGSLDLLDDAGPLQHPQVVADAADLRVERPRERAHLRGAVQQQAVDDASSARMRDDRDDRDVFHVDNAKGEAECSQEFLYTAKNQGSTRRRRRRISQMTSTTTPIGTSQGSRKPNTTTSAFSETMSPFQPARRPSPKPAGSALVAAVRSVSWMRILDIATCSSMLFSCCS